MNRIRQHRGPRCGNGLAFAWSCCWRSRRRSISPGSSSACRRRPMPVSMPATATRGTIIPTSPTTAPATPACNAWSWAACRWPARPPCPSRRRMPTPSRRLGAGGLRLGFARGRDARLPRSARAPDRLASPFPFHFGFRSAAMRGLRLLAITCVTLAGLAGSAAAHVTLEQGRSRRRFDLQGRAARRPRLRRRRPPRPSACRSPKA